MAGELSKVDNDVQQKVAQLHDLKASGKANMISSSIFKTVEKGLGKLMEIKEGINKSMASVEGITNPDMGNMSKNVEQAELELQAFNGKIRKDLNSAVKLCA